VIFIAFFYEIIELARTNYSTTSNNNNNNKKS